MNIKRILTLPNLSFSSEPLDKFVFNLSSIPDTAARALTLLVPLLPTARARSEARRREEEDRREKEERE